MGSLGRVRIRAYVPYADEKPAGLIRFCAQLVTALRSRGAHVEVVFGQLSGNLDWAAPSTSRVLFPSWMEDDSRLRPILAPLRLLWLQFGYPFVVNYRRHPLLLLAHESAPFPWWPQVSVVHDLTALRLVSRRNTFLRRMHHRAWVAGLRRSRHIIAISEATRADLLAHYPDLARRVVVIPEGVDRTIFADGKNQHDDALLRSCEIRSDFLLYAGTLAPHKNVGLLIAVLARLVADGRDIRLALAGKHDPISMDSLRRAIEENGVVGKVDFLGYVEDTTLAALMRRCSCFVFPSLNEGFGLAVAEAMACGAPVISSSAASLPEVVGDGGVLLPPDDPQPWVRTITAVLDDSRFRDGLTQRGIARSKELSWDSAAKQYLDLLEDDQGK